ncbi:glycoside hydrolase [Hypoxylon trugodes]|uniref:glycoside hydrolase n=1 Tax=Hypoxylon trugodes TaxID=326681 RepID=UPI00218D4538|nr:glycoside hydrolase [Hypoxylon trugodes]KAI1394366.1 glycoside hydrolase [Hypoxylon trugodes]
MMLSKSILFTLALVSNVPGSLAHWTYSRLVVNDEVVGEPWQYIRHHNNSNAPLTDVNSTDFRCNFNAQTAETYTVRAGDKIGFGIDEHFGHPGIQQVYLSRVPESSTAANYDGSGGWARVYSLTTAPANSTNSSSTTGNEGDDEVVTWATHNIQSFQLPLPATTPPGEYLLRAEGLALHAAHKWACAQFYVSCAQIKVVASSNIGGKGESAEFGPLVKIPGVYKGDEPGVLIPVFWSSLTNYTTPGPALWPEGTQEQHVVEQL